jgi:hypothetical protein
MSQWKDILCLLAILAAYGLTGHLDYQDAILMEEALRDDAQAPCAAPLSAATDEAPPPGHSVAQTATDAAETQPGGDDHAGC